MINFKDTIKITKLNFYENKILGRCKKEVKKGKINTNF